MSSQSDVERVIFRFGPLRRAVRWLNAMPHPSAVCEIAATHVAAARWRGRRGNLEGYAAEPLPQGALVPSPIESNFADGEAVRSALRKVFGRVPVRSQYLALLIPDPVIRVFILPFETFPRRAEEASALLRWRLKKSVPFDVEETVISWMRQSSREGKCEVVAALGRQKIVREYEEALEAGGFSAGVVLSSTLATLSLLESEGSTLIVRLCGGNLTTVIAQGRNLCVYRSTEMPADPSRLEPQAVLDEVYPAVAYYQDTRGGSPDRVRLAGLGEREEVVRRLLARELGCGVLPLADGDDARQFRDEAKSLMNHGLESLVGWMANQGA